MTPRLFALVLIACSAVAHATTPIATSAAVDNAPQRVEITSSGFASMAGKQSITYSGDCAGPSYQFIMDMEQKTLLLVLNNSARTSTDISDTRFGAGLLGKVLMGQFIFRCHSGAGMGMQFIGLEAQIKGPPKPVQLYLKIRETGEIADDSGPNYESSFETVSSQLRAVRH